MKRVLPIALAVIAVLIIGLLVGPSFVDWNKYKPEIIAQAKNAAGYDVKIDGDIGLSLLPMPQLKIEGLSVLAPRGKAANLLTMKQANVSVDLLPLLSGNVVIDTVRLVNPDIQLEKLPDGQNSWMSDKLNAKDETASPGSKGASSGGGSTNVTLNALEIIDGRLTYSDRQSGKEQKIEALNASVQASTLQGPFKASGKLTYNGKVIEFDGKSGQVGGAKKDIDIDATVGLPESNASFAFKGVVGLEPLDVQGKIEAKADDLASALAFDGAKPNAALAKKLAFAGLVSANEERLQTEDMEVTFGDAKGKGGIVVSGLKEQAPVTLQADLAFEGILNFDTLVVKSNKGDQPSVEERVAKGQKLSSNAGFLPETLSLPFPLEANIRISADGIQSGGKVFKGLVADISKKGNAIDLNGKVLDIPGKTKAEGSANLQYATSSKSGDKGVIYADPKMTFAVTGYSEQLPSLLRAFAPEQDGNAALEIFKTAQFNISGDVAGKTASVRNSTLKLDQTTVALAASYSPLGAGGRADVMIDMVTDTVDIDYIQSRLNGQKKAAVQKDTAAKADLKKSLESVRAIEIPVNLTFDLSAQQAIFNKQTVKGIRIKGKAAGPALNLESASVQDYMGAVASLKGGVTNLKDLSGIDLSFYGKTGDLKALMQSLQMDVSKVPAAVSGAEANIAAKGTANDLGFDANIAALSGQLKASGRMTDLLGQPSFSNLAIGAKHPNLVKAMQIVNPTFTGGPGLEQPFEFNANAVKTGNDFDLSGMKASLGTTTVGGNLKISTGGAIPSISGKIDAGNIALDSLLGAKNAAAKSSGGGASSAASGGGKWSKATLETGWMHTINVDLALSAKSITYGGWNFVNPNTKITLKDGNLLVDKLTSGLFGGQANLSAKVQDPVDSKQPLSIALQSAMQNVSLEQLVTAMSGTNRLKASGDVSLDMNIQTTGLSPHALISGLQGKANLNGRDVVMKGFDLAQIGLAFVDTGKPMDRVNSLVGGATQSGETRFDTIKGAYDIMQGVANITSMAMDGPAASIVSKGNVNLPLWTIDTLHTMTFKQAKDAGSFDVAIKGPLDSPGNTFGRGLFNDVLTRRLQQKAVEKLPDVLGKDLSGKLQNLGILPQQQKQVAPAQQAPVTTDPNAPAVQPQPVAPAVEPKPQSKQEKQEEAIKNVLDGFLR